MTQSALRRGEQKRGYLRWQPAEQAGGGIQAVHKRGGQGMPPRPGVRSIVCDGGMKRRVGFARLDLPGNQIKFGSLSISRRAGARRIFVCPARTVTYVLLLVVPQLLEYVSYAGVSPFARWRDGLNPVVRARVTTAVYRLEAGNFSAAKGAGAGIFELRMDFGPGYRVYFGKDGEELVVLLGGGSKKRQQADIEAAQALWQEYRARKRKRRSDGTDPKI